MVESDGTVVRIPRATQIVMYALGIDAEVEILFPCVPRLSIIYKI